MTVLYEFHRQAQFTKLIRAECLHEKASGIANNLRNDDEYLIQVNGFDLERHQKSISLFRTILRLPWMRKLLKLSANPQQVRPSHSMLIRRLPERLVDG